MTVLEMFSLTNQVAVVTGALGKLGPLWCQALLEAGAKVAALDLNTAQTSEAFQVLQAAYPKTQLACFSADVTDKASLETARAQIESALGPITILVNNAGIDQPPGNITTYTLPDFPQETFAKVLQVNVQGAFCCMQVFGAGMAHNGHGSIINIGSLYASVSPDARLYDHLPTDPPFLKPPAYGASKAALVNLTQYFATHWGAAGVRVNALSPGGVEGAQDKGFKAKFTQRVPMGRMAQGSDLVGPLLFLASPASCYVTGIELKVDGGYTAW